MPPRTGQYKDVPAFIYGITREIWEDRGIGRKLQRYYAENCLVRAATGLTTDNRAVTAQTLQTLHQFPDRQLVGEDVIWTAYDDGSFLSSHRLVSVMRHQGNGSYGKATSRLVKSRIIADCWVKDEVVTEEWLVRDQAAFARCLGLEPREMAREMATQDARATGKVAFYLPEHDVTGSYRPHLQAAEEIDLTTRGYRRIWEEKDSAAIRDLYFHGANLSAPGGEIFYGHGDIDRFYLGYLASIPDAVLTIDSALINRDPGRPIRIALRWSLRGTHAGFGHFGEPTGAPLYVMGLSQAHVVDNRVVSEWVLTDEVSIWKQIYAHAG